MADEYFLGERVVRVDGNVAYHGRTVLSDHSGVYPFDLGGAPASLEIRTNGFVYRYDLVVDGLSVSAGKRADAAAAAPLRTPALQRPIVATVGSVIAALVLGVAGGQQLWSIAQNAMSGANARVGTNAIIVSVGVLATEAFFVWSAVSGVSMMRHASRMRRALVAAGRETEGDVVAYRTVRGLRWFTLDCQVRYAYADQRGVRHEGWSPTYDMSAVHRWPIGAKVRVRYDPERPADSEFRG